MPSQPYRQHKELAEKTASIPGLPSRVGVELEAEPLEMLKRSPDTLLEIDRWKDLVKSRVGDDVRVSKDPSLGPGGIELAFENPTRARVRKIIRLLKEQRMGVTPRTGLHVHTDARDLSLEDVLKLYMDELGAKGFEAYDKRYMQSPYNRPIPEALREALTGFEGDKKDLAKVLEKYLTGSPEEYLSNARGHVININPWYRETPRSTNKQGQGSIEYRTGITPVGRDGKWQDKELKESDIFKALHIIGDHRRRVLEGAEKEAVLTRYTDPDTGAGAYEAVLSKQDPAAREQLLMALRKAWALPNPGDLRSTPDARSFFTEAGAHEFEEKHRALLEAVLKKELVKRLLSEDGVHRVVHRDMYQVVGEPVEKEAGTLYHGSSQKIDELEPRDSHGDPHEGKAVFATPSKAFALAYTGRPWSDVDILQGGMGKDDLFLAEARPGALKDIFENTTGYLHHLPDETFQKRNTLGNDWEVVSRTKVKPERVEEIKDILKALQSEGVRLVEYDPKSREVQANTRWSMRRLKLMTPEDRKHYLKWRLRGMREGGAVGFEEALRKLLRKDPELRDLADIEAGTEKEAFLAGYMHKSAQERDWYQESLQRLYLREGTYPPGHDPAIHGSLYKDNDQWALPFGVMYDAEAKQYLDNLNYTDPWKQNIPLDVIRPLANRRYARAHMWAKAKLKELGITPENVPKGYYPQISNNFATARYQMNNGFDKFDALFQAVKDRDWHKVIHEAGHTDPDKDTGVRGVSGWRKETPTRFNDFIEPFTAMINLNKTQNNATGSTGGVPGGA